MRLSFLLTTFAISSTIFYACNKRDFASQVNRKEVSSPSQPVASPSPTPTPAAPNADTTPVVSPTPTATDPSKPGIVDWIGGLVGKIPKIDINAPNLNDIEFGSATRSFHIGDGEMSQSSCKLGVILYPTRGTQYYFEFMVQQDNTLVDIEINRICGVDYAQTNLAALTQNSNVLYKKELLISSKEDRFPRQTLNKGTYFVVIESLQNPERNNDRDDFIVGKIKIHADKPITSGRVGTRP